MAHARRRAGDAAPCPRRRNFAEQTVRVVRVWCMTVVRHAQRQCVHVAAPSARVAHGLEGKPRFGLIARVLFPRLPREEPRAVVRSDTLTTNEGLAAFRSHAEERRGRAHLGDGRSSQWRRDMIARAACAGRTRSWGRRWRLCCRRQCRDAEMVEATRLYCNLPSTEGAWSSGRARLVLSVSESGIETREGALAAGARSVNGASGRRSDPHDLEPVRQRSDCRLDASSVCKVLRAHPVASAHVLGKA